MKFLKSPVRLSRIRDWKMDVWMEFLKPQATGVGVLNWPRREETDVLR